MLMRSAFFWDITQRRMVILYRRFGTTYLSHPPLKVGQIRCPATSVKDYRSTLHNIPEERRSHTPHPLSYLFKFTDYALILFVIVVLVVLPSSAYLFTAGVEVVYFHLITLRHTPQSVGLLWTRNRPVAETST
jgi:hypothetical protein